MPRDSGVIRFSKWEVYIQSVCFFPAECKRMDFSRSFGEYYNYTDVPVKILHAFSATLFTYVES